MKRKPPKAVYSRVVRRLRGPFSQTELALKTSLALASIQDWEAGRTRPRESSLRKLLDHAVTWRRQYQLPTDELLTDTLALLLIDEPVTQEDTP